MPVYSNARCCMRVHREPMHVHRTRSTSSRVSTSERRAVCQKKRCVDATTRANFSRSTRRHARNRCDRRVRIDVLNVSINIADTHLARLDACHAKSMQLRWPMTRMHVPQIACRTSDARGGGDTVETSMRARVRAAPTRRCWCRRVRYRHRRVRYRHRCVAMPKCGCAPPRDCDAHRATHIIGRGKTLFSNR